VESARGAGCCRASTGATRRPKARASSPAGPRPPIRDAERLWSIVDTLVEIAGRAERVGCSGRARVDARTAGGGFGGRRRGRNEAQLRDNLGAADLKLTADQRTRLEQT